jgi:hypothetical protein
VRREVKELPAYRVESERKSEMTANFRAVVKGSLLACAALMTFVAVLYARPAVGAQPPPAADPEVIRTWDAIAVTTIAGPAPNGAGKANAEGFLWFPFVQAAVYNAVNGITGEYELYKWSVKAPKGASPQAAAAAAAHGVLMEYFGTGDYTNSAAIAANLNAQLATSLGQIPDGLAKEQGIRYGERAVERLVELRLNDGRGAAITFDEPAAAGVWRPTPPGFVPFFAPWLAQVTPFVMDSPSQFRPGPPPAISSDLYVEEFEEVRDYGAATGSLRTVGPGSQTETALFFTDVTIGPLHIGLRDLATRRGLDISDSARLFAAVTLSMGDAAIAVWDSKLHYGYWRPITAIREADTDGNPQTTGVPTWTPLIGTPPYPDYASGLNGIVGAASTALSQLSPDGQMDLNLTSATAGVTRHYDVAADIQHDAIDARVFSGIHFRTADEVAAAMGTQIANWALDHYFAPAN